MERLIEDYASDAAVDGPGAAIVRVDALHHFDELVRSLGGDPAALLARAQIDQATLHSRHAVISYRTMVHLLERAAAELSCHDFGMRLARLQGGAKVLGPLEVAMKNSESLAEAFRYCAKHIQAYSSAAQICFEPAPESDDDERRSFMRFEILLSRLPYQRQTVEQALLLTHLAALDISDGRAHTREVWFSHEPLAPPATYRAYFGCVVRFEQPANGLLFAVRDLELSISNPDPQLFELAASFIDTRFPDVSIAISARVRALIGRLLDGGDCTNERVAAALGLHPRTLQRRLRAEGQCFEGIKDQVRRDVAVRYLGQASMPLTRVAEMLGYSEASVLSRSCHRWFAASPRQLRRELAN